MARDAGPAPDAAPGWASGAEAALSGASGAKAASAVVCEIYGAALNPAHYERLVDAWERAIARTGGPRLPALDPEAARRHAEQAGQILESGAPYPDIERLFALYGHLPALLMSADGVVLRLNAEAEAALAAGAPPETEDADAPVETTPEDLALPSDLSPAARWLLGGRMPGSVVRRIPVPFDEGAPCSFVILFDRAANARVAGQIARAFDLTEAEEEVLSLSLQCLSRKQIAARRSVSPETVKKQMERIFAKTGAQSQLELTLISASMYREGQSTAPAAPRAPHPGPPYFRDERHLHADGRTISYRVFGDPDGQPLLYFHGTFGFCLWPESAEREAARRGYRVIVPIRPGYGNTSGLAPGTDTLAGIFADIRKILTREGVRACTAVTLENDSFLAFSLAARHPEILRGIVAFAGVLPMTRDAQYRRMDKWHRFVVGTAHYTPALIPLVARGGFHFAARIGRAEFVRQVYGDSPADVALLQRPETRQAILNGTRVTLSPRHLAHRAYAQEMREFARGDWGGAVAGARGRLPVHFVNGATDPIAPPETIAEFREDYPWISFEMHEAAGQFIFFSHWPRLFAVLAEMGRESARDVA
ncbi:alpha/beta fold hydrolase [Phaeovulum vinaykumarii]|uniref:DNA-binding transcriptional regulator, CsgD family n=1 Tax=Phaeovulum vinaykumarii TaxID=407234 RepID=A0A1N7LXP3_9RHOB|nr:alpha/beta fold hydrolase [Phaeovulum vinaykumarii]SIS78471.1 DNA-binding transcriptional regulator, CsgD family [Phaeovulum vinaykumarii]SOC07006.1 DNA-binding CsgD family transcriptional regulator [Phaeovulum vinaykumarii]